MKKHQAIFLVLFTIVKWNPVHAQCVCPFPVYSEIYDSLSAYTYYQNTPGSLTSVNGELSYNAVRGSDYHHIVGAVPGLSLVSNFFSVSCRFKLIDGNSPGHMLIMLTKSDTDAYTFQSPYPKTPNDALGIAIISPNMPSSDFCCQNPTDVSNPWGFGLFVKQGTVLDLPTYLNTIHIPTLNTTYYLLLQRISLFQVIMSVCYDSLYTQHLPGSPFCAAIPPDLGPFNYLQQGVLTPASYYRYINGTLDNLAICSGLNCEIQCLVSVQETAERSHLFELETNPAREFISVNMSSAADQEVNMSISDITGKVVFDKTYSNYEKSVKLKPGIQDGIYFLNVRKGNICENRRIVFLNN